MERLYFREGVCVSVCMRERERERESICWEGEREKE